ncbi:MAG: phosphatase, partial [Synergistaceae bacterium]|nr:phosphatase [Synergistaceae bacterium]
MIRLRADLHTHSLASGHAYSTIKEMAESAQEKDLELIAITDHGSAMEGASHFIHFQNLSALPRTIKGVTIVKGIEANVIDMDGRLDADRSLLSRLEWVIASLHENVVEPANPKVHTEMYLKLAENPFVDMIGHPDTTAYEFDYERVIREFGAKGKIVEINNHHAFHLGARNRINCEKIAKLCMKHGVRVAVNSDAHICYRVGEMGPAVEMLEDMKFPEDLILNLTARRVLDYLK